MAMKELMRVTLDEAQIREACEEAVRARLSNAMADENVRAIVKAERADGARVNDALITVDVVVTRKRERERKVAAE